MPKILFLYTELADYFLSCVAALVQEYEVEVHIVRWPVNKEAPFRFNLPEGVKVYDKHEYTRQELLQMVQKIRPSLIFCSGWLDKDYVAVAKSFDKKIPVVLGLDNHWFGHAKQQVARLLAPFTLQRIFTHAFVAGVPQAVYANKLSFAPNRILQGYYSANVPAFHKQFQDNLQRKSAGFPKRFIYVGRYVPQKGLDILWEAFASLQTEQQNEWELWCLGTGPLQQAAISHPQIKHFGFVQPDKLCEFIDKTGVFVLPSLFEPWGVVVHEFAAAGFPLLCSDKVGAATAFLDHGQNGYTFQAGNVASLQAAMKLVMAKSEQELVQMGERSVALALENTPSIWADKLMKLL